VQLQSFFSIKGWIGTCIIDVSENTTEEVRKLGFSGETAYPDTG
jgi:hypothetical protein